MNVTVDAGRCIGCGMCAAAVPEVFHLENGVSRVVCQPGEPRESRTFDAANGCPVNAIEISR